LLLELLPNLQKKIIDHVYLNLFDHTQQASGPRLKKLQVRVSQNISKKININSGQRVSKGTNKISLPEKLTTKIKPPLNTRKDSHVNKNKNPSFYEEKIPKESSGPNSLAPTIRAYAKTQFCISEPAGKNNRFTLPFFCT
jgi:hypothetical protein